MANKDCYWTMAPYLAVAFKLRHHARYRDYGVFCSNNVRPGGVFVSVRDAHRPMALANAIWWDRKRWQHVFALAEAMLRGETDLEKLIDR